MTARRVIVLSCALLLAAGVFVPAGAQAQAVRPPSPEEVLRLPPAMQVAAQAMGDDHCAPPPAKPDEVASESVSALSITGMTEFRADRFDALVHPLIGAKVSPEALNRVAAEVVCAYRQRGFVFARAVVSKAGDGDWRVTVHEGVLGRVESAVENPREASALRRAFQGLRPGKPINANDVRRGLLTAGVLGFVDVRPTVRQSRSDPDELDIVLVAQAPASMAQLHVDDYNSHVLGAGGALGSVTFNGLTPFYDRTSMGVFHTIDGDGQVTYQSSTHVLDPLTGTDVGLDLAYSRAYPGQALKPLDLVSTTYYGRLSLNRYLMVRRGLVTQGSLGFEMVNQDTDLFGDFPFIRDKLRILSARGAAQALAWGGVANGSLEVRKGLDDLGASEPGDPLLSVAKADPQATVVRGEVDYSRVVGPIGVIASVRGQYTDHTLTSFEQMTFGDLNGGPAFEPAAVAGDRGVAMTLQLQGRPMKGSDGLTVQPYVFSDAARISRVNAPNETVRWAADAGAGLRITPVRGLGFNIVYATPLAHGDAAPKSYGSRLLVSLDMSLDNPFGRMAHLFAIRESTP